MASPSAIGVDLARLAQAVHLPLPQVESVVGLLDAGNTIPFITRYRKDQTGGLDEEQIRAVQSRLGKLRLVAERKQTILRSIDAQGKLAPALAAEIEAADSVKQLEDLYLPFKPKKQTLATIARERGLQPLAEEVLAAAESCRDLDARAAEFVNPERGLASAADVLLGVGHILAEMFSEWAALRQRLRKIIKHTGKLASSRAEGSDEKQAQIFRDYFDYREQLSRLPPHRALAINRGERAKLLRVKVEADWDAMNALADEMLVAADHPHAEFLRGCGRDALARLIFPSLEREARRELTDLAEAHAVEVFARNLRKLLLQPPVCGRRVLAIDPGFKSGCKLAALDEFGKLLDHAVIHVVGKPERKLEGRQRLVAMAQTHQLGVIAIGNGTACREVEELITDVLANELAEQGASFVIVNEAGASVYSTSPLGREEFPDYDATLRGGISIGRRLLDPLSELVKIDPPSLGVGLYQHDVKAKHLRTSLDSVVESCVSYVGVDANTASPALLRYVSGLNQLTARRLYDHRAQHGPFTNRQQLQAVQGLGEATFVQAAGFLKITGGDNPLDATWIHPESYELARRVLERLGATPADLVDKEGAARVAQQVAAIGQEQLQALASELGCGLLLLQDILAQLTRPGRDPREDLPPPVFKKGIIKLEDLAPGMELTGTVLNVVDFGAFVDIGLHDTGLVHISQMANRYVRDPHDVVSVGDVVRVWVHDIDKTRRRVSLTMIAPGTQRPPKPERGKRPPRDGQQGRRPRGGQPPQVAPSATDQPVAAAVPAAGGGSPPQQGRRPDQRDRGGRRGDGQRRGKPQTVVAEAPPPQKQLIDRTPRPPSSRTARRGPPGRGGPRQGGPGKDRGPSGHGGRRGDAQHEPAAAGEAAKSPPAKPKKLIPPPSITPGMRAGREPLRTFGDLKQLFDLADQPAEEAQGAATHATAHESPTAADRPAETASTSSAPQMIPTDAAVDEPQPETVSAGHDTATGPDR